MSQNLVTVAVVGDTHACAFKEIAGEILDVVDASDWLIHVGDYISKDVFDGFRDLKKERFRGVYGNTDPMSIWMEVPSKDIVEIGGKRIGITHPSAGGPAEDLEKRVLAQFQYDDVDVVVFGHAHEPMNKVVDRMLLFSPGKGYKEQSYFGPATSIGRLLIGKTICGEILMIGSI